MASVFKLASGTSPVSRKYRRRPTQAQTAEQYDEYRLKAPLGCGHGGDFTHRSDRARKHSHRFSTGVYPGTTSVAPRSGNCAKDGVTLELAIQIFTSWNPLTSWLRQIERLRHAA